MLLGVSKRDWKKIVLIFVTAFAARALFFFLFRHENSMWSLRGIGINGWFGIAERLALGRGYTEEALLTYFKTDHLVPTAARSPLPILILAGLLKILGSHYYYPLFIYSWMLSSLAAVFLYFFTAKMLESRLLALITALIYALYPPEMAISIGYAAASESLFTLLLLLYFFILFRSIEVNSLFLTVLSGGILALACLTRPVILFFPFLYMVWMARLHGREALKFIFLFSATFVLVLSPWILRNQKVFHKPIVATTLGGYNLLRHNGMIERNKYHVTQPNEFDPIAREVIRKSGRSLESLNEVELDAILKNEAMRIIKVYPLRYVKLCFYRLGWIWYKINAEKPIYYVPNVLIYVWMFPGLIWLLVRRHALSPIAWHFVFFCFGAYCDQCTISFCSSNDALWNYDRCRICSKMY